MKRSRFTESQIVRILKEVEGGRMVKDVCRAYGMSDDTYYNWKATVAAPFSTGCRFVNTDNLGDFGLANSCFHKGANLVSLFPGELRVISH